MATAAGPDSNRIEVEVIGPCALTVDGRPVALTPLRRRVLAALVLAGDRGASIQRLIQLVWPEGPPTHARQSLHNQLSWLRERCGPGVLERFPGGYRLAPGAVGTDEAALLEAARLVGGVSPLDPARSVGGASPLDPTQVLARTAAWANTAAWAKGTVEDAFSDLDAQDRQVQRRRRAAHEARAQVVLRRARALSLVGRTDEVVTVLEELLERDPCRTEAWTLLASTLERDGRAVEVLDTLRSARSVFIGGFGLDLPVALVEVERRVLAGPAADGAGHPGRHDPLPRRALQRAVDAAMAPGRVVVVSGPAGAGKSVLLQALARDGARDGKRRLHLPGSRGPWQCLGVIDALLTALGGPATAQVDHLDVAVAAQRHGPASLHTVAAAQRREVYARALHRALAVQDGLDLLIDDAHRLGPLAQDLLVEAVRHPHVRVVLTVRDAGELVAPLRASSYELAVPPLSAQELLGWLRLRGALGPDLPSQPGWGLAVASWLLTQTGGWPGTALPTASALLAGVGVSTCRQLPVTVHLDELGAAGIPVLPSVHARYAAVLHQLSVRTRRWLDVLAVLGPRVAVADLERLVGCTEPEEAVRAGILVQHADGSVELASPLLRRILLEEIPAGRRAELECIAVGASEPAAAEGPTPLPGRTAQLLTPDVDRTMLERSAAHSSAHGGSDTRVGGGGGGCGAAGSPRARDRARASPNLADIPG